MIIKSAGMTKPLSFQHVAAISSLLGALVGGLAAIGGAWLQARNAARLQREKLFDKKSVVKQKTWSFSKSDNNLSRAATSTNSGMPWTRYGIALIIGRHRGGTNVRKRRYPATGK